MTSIVASQLVGDKQREVEFMMRARHLLDYLFDCSLMEVAEGLVCMAYLSFSRVSFSFFVCFGLSMYNMG